MAKIKGISILSKSGGKFVDHPASLWNSKCHIKPWEIHFGSLINKHIVQIKKKLLK